MMEKMGGGVIYRRANFLEVVFVLCALFPWVSFGLNDMDSQPWPLFGAFVYLVSCGKFYLRRNFVCLFVLVCLSIFSVSFDFVFDFLYFRSVFSIFSLFFVSYAFWNLKRNKVSILDLLICVNIVWIVVSALQFFVNKNLFDFLVPVRTSLDRGVTGLAPEPTFCAVYFIFLSWIILSEINFQLNKKIKLLFFVNFLVILFLAKSSMGIVFLGFVLMSWIVYIALKKPIVLFIFLFFCLGFKYVVGFISGFFYGDRIANVLSSLVDDPMYLIYLDASINQRVTHPMVAIIGFFSSGGFPNGLYSFDKYAENLLPSFGGIFWNYPGLKIMSWSGSLLYELGVFGLGIVFSVCYFFWLKDNILRSFVFVLLFLSLTLAAIPVGFSLIAILVGLNAAIDYDARKFIF